MEDGVGQIALPPRRVGREPAAVGCGGVVAAVERVAVGRDDLRLEGLVMQDDGEVGGLILHSGAVNQLTHLDHSLISRRGLRDVANYAYCRHISLRLVGKVGLTEGITEDSDGGKE